jgi:hypothetical protein
MNLLNRTLLTIGMLLGANAVAVPSILYFATSQPTLKASFCCGDNGDETTVRFSLIATDSDGLSALAGAILQDPITKIPYGTFQAGSEKSAMQ